MRSRTFIILLVVFGFLLILRLFLPIIITKKINDFLGNDLKFYTGSIVDFDLALFHGAYRIEGLEIIKRENPIAPLLYIDTIDLSMSWAALFKGEFLFDIRMDSPRVNLIGDHKKDHSQKGDEDSNLRTTLARLAPFEIDSFSIKNGRFRFLNYNLKVPKEFLISDIDILMKDIRNFRKRKELLPSRLDATGFLQDRYPIELRGGFNLLQNPLAFDLDLQLKDFDLTSINDLLLSYVPFSFTRGRLSVFSEVASRNGQVIGYIKPFIKNVDVVESAEQFENFKHFGFEMIGALSNILLKNRHNFTTATRLEFSGNLKDPNFDFSKAFGFTLEHRFGEPHAAVLENSIDISGCTPPYCETRWRKN